VGATRGYQDNSGTAATYAAIPTWPDGLVEFARKDTNGWSKVTYTCPSGSFGCVSGVASTWAGTGGAGLAPGGTQPRAAARPGLAYQMRSGQVITLGRFYMAINQAANCSDPFGTPSGTPAGCPSVLIMTEGNLATGTPTTRRLRWITPAQGLVGNFPVGGISLLDDLSRDVNLRVLVTAADGKARFMPLADGIINTSISDMDDRPYVSGGLRASLCRDGGTWPWGCVLPPSLP
jgi:hypothetical protein